MLYLIPFAKQSKGHKSDKSLTSRFRLSPNEICCCYLLNAPFYVAQVSINMLFFFS